MARLVLVGLPGSGKSTVGPALALALDIPFVDADDAFAAAEGVTAADFLRREGEPAFRQREADVVASLLDRDIVVATGGGAVTTPLVRDLLADEVVVWLDAADAVLLARVATGDRPLLGDAPAERLVALRAERSALYDAVSCCCIDTDRPVDDVVDAIRQATRGQCC